MAVSSGLINEQEEAQRQKDQGFIVRRTRTATQVDDCLNNIAKKRIKDVLCKDKPSDLFKDLIDGLGENLVKKDERKWVAYKFKAFKIEKNLNKIHNLIDSRQITGPRFIMARLRIYQLNKAYFIA